MQDDVGSAIRAVGGFYGESLDAVGVPLAGLVAPVCSRDHGHVVGDHEARVKADAELPDDVDVFVLLGLLGAFHLEA